MVTSENGCHKLPNATIWSYFEKAAGLYGPHPAIVHGDNEISYSDLALSVSKTVKALNKLNLQPGDRIALIANKNLETVTAILAALRIKVVLVIINPLLKTPQIAHILADSGSTTLLSNQHNVDLLLLDGTVPKCLERIILMPSLDDPSADQIAALNDSAIYHRTTACIDIVSWHVLLHAPQTSKTDILQSPADSDTAVILYTSGSTGTPKGVAISHANLCYGAASVSTYLEYTREDRILALPPLSFDYGLNQLTSTVFIGATLVLHDYIVPLGVINAAKKHRVSGIPAVPHLWDQLAKLDWSEVKNLRYITNTGGRLQHRTIQTLSKKLPNTAIYSMYGFTEAFRATYLPPTELANKPESVGKSVPFAEVLVVDNAGRELSPGEQGELIQSGPLVSQGYWNDVPSTLKKFRKRSVGGNSEDTYAWSGDIGYKDAEGYIYFVTRKDDQIKLNGHRVSPSEIESALLKCPWISEASVCCIPHQRFGNVAVAFIILASSVDPTNLSLWFKKVLPSYMVPARWIIIDEFPVTPNNKIDKAALLTSLSAEN